MSGDDARKNLDIYNRDAAKLVKIYNTRATEFSLPGFTREIMSMQDREGLWALDLGCGSGKHAAWLARQGFSVVAADGAENMLAEARAVFPDPRIQWVHDDTAPALSVVRSLGRMFDVVLMAAFLFHFDENERTSLLESVKAVSKPGAYAYTTLRHGTVPEGRVMHAVPVGEIEAFAKQNARHFADLGRREDPLGRKDISWDHVEMRF